MKTVQIIAIVSIAVLVLNIILLALRKINYIVFWMIIGIIFVVSYVIKKQLGER